MPGNFARCGIPSRLNQIAQFNRLGRHSFESSLILLADVADSGKQHFMDRPVVASQVDDESAADRRSNAFMREEL
jgi:hypothetical protein